MLHDRQSCCTTRSRCCCCCCFACGSGIKTNIGTINTWRYWGVVLCLIVLATAAKFVPACLTSKVLLRHRSWRFCSALGLMMNTRGLVELIALNIGLSMVRGGVVVVWQALIWAEWGLHLSEQWWAAHASSPMT
jgi:Kef-type K+ transport system membrane component KefB